jgi:PEP-CTERM motif
MTRSMLRCARVAMSLSLLALSPIVLHAQATTLDLPNPSPVDPASYFLSGPFGKSSAAYPASLAVGQTFTVPIGYSFLQSFSFWLADDAGLTINGAALQFRGYVAEWDGAKAGNVLFTSGVMYGQQCASVQQACSFQSPNVTVAGGQQYVAFLSAVGLFGDIAETEASLAINTVFDPAFAYAGGAFVSTNTGASLSDLSSTDWENTGTSEYQSQFSATFTTNVVPEPSSLLLMAVGAAGLLVVARRRRA